MPKRVAFGLKARTGRAVLVARRRRPAATAIHRTLANPAPAGGRVGALPRGAGARPGAGARERKAQHRVCASPCSGKPGWSTDEILGFPCCMGKAEAELIRDIL